MTVTSWNAGREGMSPVRREVDIALHKQRLQIQAEQQRMELLAGLAAVEGVLDGADRFREGLAWLREHATAVTALALILLVLRPRFALRWGKRVWRGWRLYRQLRVGLESALASL